VAVLEEHPVAGGDTFGDQLGRLGALALACRCRKVSTSRQPSGARPQTARPCRAPWGANRRELPYLFAGAEAPAPADFLAAGCSSNGTNHALKQFCTTT
jgi:hypothetical protein